MGLLLNNISEIDSEFRLNSTVSHNVHQRRLNDASSVISKSETMTRASLLEIAI